MYKVVIVDDEPITVEGLKKSIPWERWDCEVVATAHSGRAGREVIEKYKPDIVFSDIAMPGGSGLEMIAGFRSENENTEVSILTGYRDFDYAQQAIKLGVRRFLLKPSKLEEIKEAVEAMVKNLKKDADGQGKEEVKEQGIMVAHSFIVNNAMSYIRENYQYRLTLSEVADETYVSPGHLSKLLNRHVGQSFSDILNGVRMEKAKELLKEKSLKVGEIAEEVGFSDLAHFSRVFKKMEGISAIEYRNSLGIKL